MKEYGKLILCDSIEIGEETKGTVLVAVDHCGSSYVVGT